MNKVLVIVLGALVGLLIIVVGFLGYLGYNASNSDDPAPAPAVVTPTETTDPASVLNDVMEQQWATLSYSDQQMFCTGFLAIPDELFKSFSDGFEGSAGTAFPRSVFDSFYGAKCASY